MLESKKGKSMNTISVGDKFEDRYGMVYQVTGFSGNLVCLDYTVNGKYAMSSTATSKRALLRLYRRMA